MREKVDCNEIESNKQEGPLRRVPIIFLGRDGQIRITVVFVNMVSRQRCSHLFQSDLGFVFGVERNTAKYRSCGVRNRILIQAMMRVNDGEHS